MTHLPAQAATAEREPIAGVAFDTMSDARFFIGAVALVNSLRLVGHREPVYVLDCGLEPWQSEALAPHVQLVAAPPARSPILLTYHAPLLHPAELIVSIDADIIATRSFADLMQRSVGDERVIAFVDARPRFEPTWADVLELDALREEPYVTNGIVLLPGELGRSVFTMLREGQERVDFTAQTTFIDFWDAWTAGRATPELRLRTPSTSPSRTS